MAVLMPADTWGEEIVRRKCLERNLRSSFVEHHVRVKRISDQYTPGRILWEEEGAPQNSSSVSWRV